MKITPIKKRRVELGLDNTDEVAEKLGISKSTFYKLEQGHGGTPSAKLIKRISDLYGCTTDDIFKDLKITG